MSDDYKTLVDHSINDAAREKLNEAIERLRVAEAGATTAQAAHADAERTAARAAAGEIDTDPLAAEHALTDRQIELASAIRVRDAAQTRREKTHANLAFAEAVAWLPVLLDGARARIAACRKGDEARRMLAEAEKEFIAADQQLQHARGRGVPTGPQSGNGLLQPLAAELAHWSALKPHGVDVEAGTATWRPAKFIA